MGDVRISVGDREVVIAAELQQPADDTLFWSVDGPFSTIGPDQHVILDEDADVAGLTIRGSLKFAENRSVTLTSTKSIIVEGGTLSMSPDDGSVKHEIRFYGFSDAVFGPGGGDVVVPSDIGLWCHMGGVLDLHGEAKAPWTFLNGGLEAAGATTFDVNDAEGWRVGDEIVVTATARHAQGSRFVQQAAWDRRTIKAIAGNRIQVSSPLSYSHPTTTFNGRVYTAEVLNLTRNVKIGGTPSGRAHVHVMAHDGHGVPFDLDFVELAHVGPARGSADSEGRYRDDVLGRYGLHFHKTGWALAGSTMTGVVVRDSRSHAFVPHMSHGLTFRGCISHVSHQTAFWWDFPTSGSDNEDSIPTHSLTYDTCVASAMANNTGFFLGFGFDQSIEGCVATGSINNNSFDNGVQAFTWDSSSRPLDHTVVPAGSSDVWEFFDNLAHNTNGPANYWQNNVGNTKVDGLVAYNCNHMVRAGAYINAVDYLDFEAFRVGAETDSDASFDIHSSSSPPGGLRQGFWIDANGENPYALRASNPPVPSSTPTVVRSGHFRGGTKAQVLIENPNIRFEDCTFLGNEFWLGSLPTATPNILVVRTGQPTLRLWPLTSNRGTRKAEWNCRVETLT